jgi:DNA-directed RNA polymerase specialized sigma24 family protein
VPVATVRGAVMLSIEQRVVYRERFRDAARTLRMLRLSSTDAPAKLRSGWPEIVRTQREVFAAEVDATPEQRRDMHRDRLNVRLTPTTKEVSDMDEVLRWLSFLTDEQRKVVFARALGMPARKIAERLHCSRRHVYDVECQSYVTIATKLSCTLCTL